MEIEEEKRESTDQGEMKRIFDHMIGYMANSNTRLVDGVSAAMALLVKQAQSAGIKKPYILTSISSMWEFFEEEKD